MSSDRAAVAREVLTELLEFAYARAETVSDTRQFMRERYPAPPAPETVTVGGRAWARDVDGWWVHHSDISHDVCGPRSTIGEMCARIASDARRMIEMQAERETARAAMHKATRALDAHTARIAELEQEREEREEHTIAWCGDGALEAPTDGYFYTADAVRQFIQYVGATKGEGRGEVGVSTAAHGGSSVTRPDQGESPVAAPSPAPIPLGETMEVDGVKWARTELGWNGGAWRYHDSSTVARVLTALYRARHPVATRETVERVAKAIDDADSDSLCPVWDVMTVHQKSVLCDMARAALTAAGFTLEEGA